MDASRKVIVILSRHYLMCDIHKIELDQAVSKMYDMSMEKIVIIDINKVSAEILYLVGSGIMVILTRIFCPCKQKMN